MRPFNRHLILRKEQAQLLNGHTVFKVLLVRKNDFLLKHGSTRFHIRGSIDGLSVGEPVVFKDGVLIPEQQPLFA